ncbi:MAG: hypothetical protein ACXV78_06085 [Candidatus Angelobacter sp.]
MKTRDLENVSRIWQLAHLRHYFGQQRAMSSVHDPKLELIVNHHRENQDGIPDSNPAPLITRKIKIPFCVNNKSGGDPPGHVTAQELPPAMLRRLAVGG